MHPITNPISPLTEIQTVSIVKVYNVASLLQYKMAVIRNDCTHHPHTCHFSVMDIQVVRSRGSEPNAVSSRPPTYSSSRHGRTREEGFGGGGLPGTSAQLPFTLGELPRTQRAGRRAGTHPPRIFFFFFKLVVWGTHTNTHAAPAFCWLCHQIFMAVCISSRSSNWVLYIQTWLTRSNSSKEWAN